MPGMMTRTDQKRHPRPALPAGAVVLVGLPGAGKSTVGRILARRLRVAFSDADREIEKAEGRRIADIFRTDGEAYFRRVEHRTLAALLRRGTGVIATGGGAFMNPDIRADIAAAGCAVWLRVGTETVWGRVGGRTGRPLLAGPDGREALERLAAARNPVYAKAGLAVDCDGLAPRETAARIQRALADRVFAARMAARNEWPAQGEKQ